MKFPWGKKPETIEASPMSYAPKYCHSDGKELLLQEEIGHDPYTGEQYIMGRFLECPNIEENNYKTWRHSAYQFMKGDGSNSIWLPLDDF
jgi:hypothetical protein